MIEDEGFKDRHRSSARAFIRERCLPFALVVVLVLRKGVKSLQNMLNEAMLRLDEPLVTASAFSQARYQFKHTAFIELNQRAVCETLYADGDYHRFQGFRVLAIDGSKVVLPNSEDVCREFGTIAWSNGKDPQQQGERSYALASVLYDVLNRVAVDATLAPGNAYEVDLAVAHLAYTQPGDLVIMDRNYPSYRMLAELTRAGRDFVIRCSAASFGEVRRMLRGQGKDSHTVTVKPCAEQAPKIRAQGLAMSLKVRFVRVQLSTGEYEVLATSLDDEKRYATVDFLELYHYRWGIETFYGLLKTRLGLENFSGTGAEAVRQDFHATVYLNGMESILTDSAQQMLDAKQTRYPQTVNREVSFNAIKNQALELLFSDLPAGPLLARLTDLFMSNPSLQRKHRNPPRKKVSDRCSLDFHKRRKKHCF